MKFKPNASSVAETTKLIQQRFGGRFASWIGKLTPANHVDPTFSPLSGTAGSMMRATPHLEVEDKIAVAHHLLRKAPYGALYLIRGDTIIGIVTIGQLNAAIESIPSLIAPSIATESLSNLVDGASPTLPLIRPAVVHHRANLRFVHDLFDEYKSLPLIAVVGDNQKFMGTISRSDLIAANLGNLAPIQVGGMATPLGVYLTDGVVQGGVGNLGLFAAGIAMTLLFFAANIASLFFLSWLQSRLHLSVVQLVANHLLSLKPEIVRGLVGGLHSVLAVLLFFLLFRFMPIAGFHAAEHQVVNCFERGEPLTPDAVKLMPRIHPRCGTNLMAAVLIFKSVFDCFFLILGDTESALIPAALATLFFWRPLGTFLQQHLTTKTASLKQLENGIKAGKDVLNRHIDGLERRASFGRRVWNMGWIQLFAGTLTVGIVLQILELLSPQWATILNQI